MATGTYLSTIDMSDIALVKENIYSVLNENGIEIPFPQADVHIRTAIAQQ